MYNNLLGSCPKCSNNFSQYNLPHKLINCQHLLCKRCLLSQKFCSVCQADINLDDHFLKDFSILSLEQVRLPSHQANSNKSKSQPKQLQSNSKANTNQQQKFSRGLEIAEDSVVDQFFIQECLLHDKPADLVCIDDQSIICSNCALFGKHKGHQVVNREGILHKFATYVEQCLTVYDFLKQQSKQLSIESYRGDYLKVINQKKKNDLYKLTEKFQQLINMIKAIQKKQILKINQFYKQKQKFYESKQQNIQKIQTEVKSWFLKIQGIGSLMSNTKSLQDLCQCIPYIDQKNNSKFQILDKGEQLTLKIKQMKGSLKNQLKAEQLNNYILFDQQKIKGLSSYFSLKDYQIQKKKYMQSAKRNKQQYSKSPLMKKDQRNGKSLSSSVKGRLKTQTPISNSKLLNFKPRIQNQIQVNLFTEDNLLLSVQPSKYSKYQQSSIMPMIQKVCVAQQVDVQNIPNLSISDIKPVTCISSGQSSEQSRFTLKYRQLKQIANQPTIMLATQTNMIDPKKRKKSEFPQKFKGIVDDLKNDRAQTIDLTGAQAGDSSILYLCPFIRKSKKLKTLKLIKNKLTDDCLNQLFQALSQTKVVNLNLSQNLLTDKACSIIQSSLISQNLKSITLTLNKINRRNVKTKTDELAKKKLAILL